ncbi:hypothetical protein ACFOUV_16200 [Oceanobacillus longus]|uniref:Phospholipid scramblase n=1 Tax=Oceanobacillus longus TaxID=930120 RepID=A0ABV8H3D6_9BACI
MMQCSGIRVKGDLKKPLSEFVAGINESDSSVISVDIPPDLFAVERVFALTFVFADFIYSFDAPKKQCTFGEESYFTME